MPVGTEITWIIEAHVALLFCSIAYAMFLDRPRVYEWYYPDHTWVTVVGGEFIIGPFVMLLFWLALPLIPATCFYITLHIAAGLPIIHWQRGRAKLRADRSKAVDWRP